MDVAASNSRKAGVVVHRNSAIAQPLGQVLIGAAAQGGMRLSSGLEIFVDTEVNLNRAALKPDSSPRSKLRRLGNLDHAQQVAIKQACRILGSPGHGELNVRDGDKWRFGHECDQIILNRQGRDRKRSRVFVSRDTRKCFLDSPGRNESLRKKHAAEGVLAGLISAVFLFSILYDPAEIYAIAIRQKWPETWFSGLITYHALFVVLTISAVAGGLAFRLVYKHSADSDRKS